MRYQDALFLRGLMVEHVRPPMAFRTSSSVALSAKQPLWSSLETSVAEGSSTLKRRRIVAVVRGWLCAFVWTLDDVDMVGLHFYVVR